VVAVVSLTANVYSAVVVVLVCAATEISEAVVIPLEEKLSELELVELLSRLDSVLEALENEEK